MDKIGTLPPRVRGKAYGVLDFFVDEIRIFGNILLLTENCDVVAQVQWWGEVLPIYIKPRQLHLPKIFKKCEIFKSHSHCATYEIKTTLDLFKSYLETCEVLELEVYEAVQTCLIGSAFLKDLISLVFENSEPIEIPFINYLGEEVGKIKIRVNFSAKSSLINKTNKNLENTEHQFSSKETGTNRKKKDISGANKTITLCPNEKTIYVSQESKNFNSLDKSFEIFKANPINYQNFQEIRSFDKCNFMKNNIAHDARSISSQKLPKSLKQHIMIYKKKRVIGSQMHKSTNKSFFSKCFPEVNISDDTSKVLYFELGLKNGQQYAAKPLLRTEENSQKDVKKLLQNIGQSSTCKKNYTSCYKKNSNINNKNPIYVSHNLKKPKMGTQNFNALPSCLSDFIPLCRSEVSSSDKIPLEQFTPDKKAVDYLLGVELSKEDEESALNDFKKMSPCHDFVSSINQLCTMSDNVSEKFTGSEYSQGKISSPTTAYFEVNCLNFDFTNIIERNYFKKFFIQPKTARNFKIPELFHKNEKTLMSEKLKSNDKIDSFRDLADSAQVKKYEDHLNFRRIGKKNDSNLKIGKDYFLNTVDAIKSFCTHCNYNKKLEELDVVIESLKHFEKKILDEKVVCRGNSAKL